MGIIILLCLQLNLYIFDDIFQEYDNYYLPLVLSTIWRRLIVLLFRALGTITFEMALYDELADFELVL